MTWPLLFGARSLVWLDRVPYLASPLPLADLATVYQIAAGWLENPANPGREFMFGDQDVQDWLGDEGAFLVVYLTLKPDRGGLTLLEARGLVDAARADDRTHEIIDVIRAAFRNGAPTEAKSSGKIDIARATWGATLARFYSEGLMPAELGRLTLPQIDNLITEGKSGDAHLDSESDRLKAEFHQMWLEQQRQRAAEEATAKPTDPPSGTTTLADLGLSVAEGQEIPPGFDGLEDIIG